MIDERLGLPSASGVERALACPGSWLLSQRAKVELPAEIDSPEASSGTRIHAALAGDKEIEAALSEDEAVTLDIARRYESQLLADFFGPNPYTIKREVRLFLFDGIKPVASGQFDVLALSEDGMSALILDLKSGWGDDIPASPQNWQLRTEVVILHELHGIPMIGVAIVQPRCGQPILCVYGKPDMAPSSKELRKGLAKAQEPDAERRAGARQCRYCPAVAICPEAQAVNKQLVARPDLRGLTPQERGDRIPLLKLGINLAERELEVYKSMLATDPQAVAGWQLVPGGTNKPITDAVKCYQQAGHLMTADEFAGCCTVGKTKLRATVKERTGMKGKALDELMGTVLAGCITEKQKAPTLEAIGA